MRVCLVPMTVEPGKRSANLGHALQRLEDAAAHEPAPDLIVLPERIDWGLQPGQLDPTLVEPRGGPFVESLAERVRELGLYLAAGLTELEDELVFNYAVLLDPDGDVILRHRLITVGGSAQRAFAPGDKLQVRQTPLGRAGLLVGADGWQAPLIDALGLMGADFIVAPVNLSPAANGPGKSQALLKKLSVQEKRRVAPLLAVGSTGQAGPNAKAKKNACAFYRDAAGRLTFFHGAGDAEAIHLEVSP